jgi:hypothetical protein
VTSDPDAQACGGAAPGSARPPTTIDVFRRLRTGPFRSTAATGRIVDWAFARPLGVAYLIRTKAKTGPLQRDPHNGFEGTGL